MSTTTSCKINNVVKYIVISRNPCRHRPRCCCSSAPIYHWLSVGGHKDRREQLPGLGVVCRQKAEKRRKLSLAPALVAGITRLFTDYAIAARCDGRPKRQISGDRHRSNQNKSINSTPAPARSPAASSISQLSGDRHRSIGFSIRQISGDRHRSIQLQQGK